MNPVPHGGMWYDSRTWRTHEETAYVRVYPGDGAFAVEHGTLYRPKLETLHSALKCCDVSVELGDPALIHAEIEAVASYCGTEQDDMRWFEKDERHHHDFNEFQICRVICDYLRQTIPEDGDVKVNG